MDQVKYVENIEENDKRLKGLITGELVASSIYLKDV